MKTLTKTIIALGVLGATVIGTAGPTFARDVRGHAFSNQAYGAYAQLPASRMSGLSIIREPTTTHRDTMSSWDPYGVRWDGSGE